MMNLTRPSWHEYFMVIAKICSSRSTCFSRPTGAVIVKDKHILTTGYNGSMPGVAHCSDEGECFRRKIKVPEIEKYNFCRATHAEANALAQAARYGISVEGSTMYCTLSPCYLCLKIIAGAGIKEVYYETAYESKLETKKRGGLTKKGELTLKRDKFWNDAAREAGIKVMQLKISPDVLSKIAESLVDATSSRRLDKTAQLEFVSINE